MLLADTLSGVGSIFICGAMNMENEVLKILQQIIPKGHCVTDYQNKGQIITDCY